MGGKTAAPRTPRRGKQAGGRPSKLDAKVLQLVEGAVRNLGPWDNAFLLGGISPATGYRWKAEGEKDRKNGRATPERQFLERLEKAEAEGKALLEGRIFRATAWDPHLAMKVLERRDPKNWSARQQLDVRDITPPAQSPRRKVLDRLEAIEDRLIRAQRSGIIPESPPPAPSQSGATSGPTSGPTQ